MFESLDIQNPKRGGHAQSNWDMFFPYYAGFPETFAGAILRSSHLANTATILDPWNGSGTTTYAAAHLGFASFGLDLNPAMVIVARARLLASSEADSLSPLAQEIVRRASAPGAEIAEDDALLSWYSRRVACFIRALEREIRVHLVSELALPPNGRLDRISGIAATFYVALFSVCRKLADRFRASNPTWIKVPKPGDRKIWLKPERFAAQFIANIHGMAKALNSGKVGPHRDRGLSEIRLADTTKATLAPSSVDFVLTSPPYCTRIDYTAATRIELAVLSPLLQSTIKDLGRQMTGSIRVPTHDISVSESWGPCCSTFLESLRQHDSKASSGYYYKTHLDYFDKIGRSIREISTAMKPEAGAIFVVQDSHYKELHNDLPTILTEMAQHTGLQLRKRSDFELRQTMARINPHARRYNARGKTVEAVLCFQKA